MLKYYTQNQSTKHNNYFRYYLAMTDIENSPIKIFLAEVINHNTSKELLQQRMEELQQLVETYGGMTVVQIVQQRVRPDYRTYL